MAVFGGLDADDDPLRVDGIDDSNSTADNHCAGIARRDLFHAGPDQRSRSPKQRHGLALHVGSHQGAVRVVVFKEWDERCSHRNQLLRRNVDVIDFIAMLQHEVAGLPDVHELVGQLSAFIHLLIRLSDEVFVFFPGRQIERIRNVIGAFSLLRLQFFVFFFNGFTLDMLGDFVLRIAGADDGHVIDNPAVLHLAVRALDEAVFVDARVAAQ